MVLADTAAALDIPTWVGIAAVGALVGTIAWLFNRSVKGQDDQTVALHARIGDEIKARHDLANKTQLHFNELSAMLHEQDKSIALIRQKLNIRE